MEKLEEQVLESFQFCQTLQCENCLYCESGNCNFQKLARDASKVIMSLKPQRGLRSKIGVYDEASFV